jgi:hypothetical protein
MKPEEAIKILQERIGLTKKVWSNVPEIIKYREALELAVKALENQTPMKPLSIRFALKRISLIQLHHLLQFRLLKLSSVLFQCISAFACCH